MKPATVKDIMTTDVFFIHPDSTLLEAAEILQEHNFDGLPVINKKNVLLGILTEYDLITKGSDVHLPTLQKVLKKLSISHKNSAAFRKEIKKIISLTVKDVMNDDPLTITPGATLEEAVALFRDHHRVNPVPVIDSKRKVVGVISRYDIIKLFKNIK